MQVLECLDKGALHVLGSSVKFEQLSFLNLGCFVGEALSGILADGSFL